MKRILPDFQYIAAKVIDKAELPALLKEMFDMGYSAGKIDADLNWYEDFDKSIIDKDAVDES